MADTSIGIAFNNLGLAWAGGAITGAIIAYRTKNYIYTLLGPFAGYVSGAPAFDVYEPWEMFLVALVAPLVAYAIYEWTQRREIDEHKLIPLFLGVGSYGILAVGAPRVGHAAERLLRRARATTRSSTPRSTSCGRRRPRRCLGVGLATAAVLASVLERTIGLRVAEEIMVEGFDLHYWDIVHDLEPAPGRAERCGPPPPRDRRTPLRARRCVAADGGFPGSSRHVHMQRATPGGTTHPAGRAFPDLCRVLPWTTSVATDTKLAA